MHCECRRRSRCENSPPPPRPVPSNSHKNASAQLLNGRPSPHPWQMACPSPALRCASPEPQRPGSAPSSLHTAGHRVRHWDSVDQHRFADVIPRQADRFIQRFGSLGPVIPRSPDLLNTVLGHRNRQILQVGIQHACAPYVAASAPWQCCQSRCATVPRFSSLLILKHVAWPTAGGDDPPEAGIGGERRPICLTQANERIFPGQDDPVRICDCHC